MTFLRQFAASTSRIRHGVGRSAPGHDPGAEDPGPLLIECLVPLAEMFGYSTVLRSLTQGQAQFTMEFSAYKQVPQSIAEELEKKLSEQKKKVA